MNEPISRTVATNLRHLRLDRGWTQGELGARAELVQSYVGQIERGDKEPSLSTVDKLSRALGVGPLDLLTPTERPRVALKRGPRPKKEAQAVAA